MSNNFFAVFAPLFALLILSVIGASAATPVNLYKPITNFVKGIDNEFSDINDDRKAELNEFANYIAEKAKNGEEINLTFICTHNSRRSHIAQLWAAVAAEYYGIPKVNTFSGGTEETAFNKRAVLAMQRVGFDVYTEMGEGNKVYIVKINENAKPIQCFSKKFDNEFNPQKNFAAIMVCSDADETCPYVPGADQRFAIPYVDPKNWDDTDLEHEKYDETVKLISRDIMYAFSQASKLIAKK